MVIVESCFVCPSTITPSSFSYTLNRTGSRVTYTPGPVRSSVGVTRCGKSRLRGLGDGS